MVLGHSGCGAIEATLGQLEKPRENRSPNLGSIVERIRPSVETLLATELRDDHPRLLEAAVRANVRVSASQLRHGSQIIEYLIDTDRLLVVGGED